MLGGIPLRPCLLGGLNVLQFAKKKIRFRRINPIMSGGKLTYIITVYRWGGVGLRSMSQDNGSSRRAVTGGHSPTGKMMKLILIENAISDYMNMGAPVWWTTVDVIKVFYLKWAKMWLPCEPKLARRGVGGANFSSFEIKHPDHIY